MTSENRESRFEELRRKARERLEQVRDSIESGMGAPSTTTPPAPPPIPQEDVSTPLEVDYYPEAEQEPEVTYQGADRSEEAWEQRVVVPSHTEPTFVPEPTRVGPTVSTSVASAVQRTQLESSSRSHGSPVSRLLQKGALREAIIAQEVLGKPLSMRPPQDDE